MKHLARWGAWVLGPIRRLGRFWGSSSFVLRRVETEVDLGQQGERWAQRYLKRQGCRILATRSRELGGELDLVVLDRRTIVFVEVKTRRSGRAGLPAEAVDRRKQVRLARLALVYLKRHRLLGHPARFDVIAIVWPQGVRRPRLKHYRNAFTSPLLSQLWG